MNAIIETNMLSFRYGAQEAVRDLNLTVPQGSIFALLGPNGAGKTTTLKALMNIVEPTSGEAFVMGVPTTRLGPTEFQRIGYVSENQELPEWMTVGAFLDYCRALYPTWDAAFCSRLTVQFQLPLDRKLKQLSRGMKMKAALLSSLAYRPRLLVLDEPFSGLDPLARDEFISGMLALVDESDWTIVISSHDIEEVERLVDWVGFLEKGGLRLCEPVAKLLERFRRLEVVLATGAVRESPPRLPHPDWLDVSVQSHALRFVESQYQADETNRRVQEIYPDAKEIQSSPMSLREIFVALARCPQTSTLKK